MSSLTSLLLALFLAALVLPCCLCLYRRYRDKQQRTIKQREHQRHLEEELKQTHNKLKTANARLFEAVARHEISQELVNEAQEYLHSILNSMPSMLIGITADGIITHWNSFAEQVTGTPSIEALGTPLVNTFAQLPISQQRLTKIIAEGCSKSFENLQTGEGSLAKYQDMVIYPLQTPSNDHASTGVNGAVIRIDDVTVRVNLENTIMQHEKLTSLGELAAGLAHELNNPLSAVLQSLQTIDRRLQPGRASNHKAAQMIDTDLQKINQYLSNQDIPLFLHNIKQAGNRASKIIHNMLEFSHANNRQHRQEDIIEVIEASLSMAMLTVKQGDQLNFKDIAIRRHYGQQLPRVCCGFAEIQQVLLNLFRNTCQALGSEQRYDASKVPTIDLSIHHDDQHMIITIKDNGPGILAEAKRHIFNPFFTTKEVGHGTGLGLSVSYFIINQRHSGNISVESEPGSGCEFIIQLPLIALLSS